MARPTKFKPEYNDQVEKLCKLGATDAQLADFFNVTEQTVNNWKAQFPEFFESIKRGKIQADIEIADSLFHRAKGYSHPDTKAQFVQGKDGGKWEYAELIKHYPPDTAAAFIWLKNRQGWADKQTVEHEGSIEHTGDSKEVGRRIRALVEAALAGSSQNGNGPNGVSGDIPE